MSDTAPQSAYASIRSSQCARICPIFSTGSQSPPFTLKYSSTRSILLRNGRYSTVTS